MPKPSAKTFEARVQPWGNSMGLRLTRAVRDLAELKEGSEVTLEITAEGVLIRKKDRPARTWTEHELLTGLTPHTAHADELPQLLAQETD
jgi:antitoxin MazE